MNKSFVFKIIYYVCFIFTIITWIGTLNSVSMFGINIEMGITPILVIFNLTLVIIFSVKSIKNKLEKVNIVFPILYLLFLLIVVILAIMMNNKLIFPNIHYSYYISIILCNYTLLNLYSILSFIKIKND